MTTLGEEEEGDVDVAGTGVELVRPPAVPDGAGPSAMYPKSEFAALPQNSGGYPGHVASHFDVETLTDDAGVSLLHQHSLPVSNKQMSLFMCRHLITLDYRISISASICAIRLA